MMITRDAFEEQVSEGIRFNPEIEKHIDIIIKLVGHEYNDRIAGLQSQMKEKEFEFKNTMMEFKKTRDLLDETELNNRHLNDENSKLKIKVENLEKNREAMDQELKRVMGILQTLEGEQKSRDHLISRLKGEVARLENEAQLHRERMVEKDRLQKDAEKMAQAKDAKAVHLENFLMTKDDIIAGLKVKIVEEQERLRKMERELKNGQEENYRLKGDVERMRIERDFLKEDFEKFRRGNSF